MSHSDFKPILYFLLHYFVFNSLYLFLEFNPGRECESSNFISRCHLVPLEAIFMSLLPIYASFMTF